MRTIREHAGVAWAIQYFYSLPDDAWHLELSRAQPAPDSWADLPGAPDRIPGAAFVVAEVPDEDPDREPTVLLTGDATVPYPVMRWFLDEVATEIERCRAALEQPAAD